MAADVRPYLVPGPGTVVFGPWTRWDGEQWVELADTIDGWDPGTDVRLQRGVQVDVERLCEETGLDGSEYVHLATSWTSSTTGMTDAAAPIALTGSYTRPDVVLQGERIGGLVRIRTTLSLAMSPIDRKPGIAWLAGSVFSDDETRTALEGSLSMFPVHDIDFARTRLPIDASWHLESTTELAAPFMGSFRLLLNRRDVELMAAVGRGVKDRRQQALCEDLESELGMEMLELAVLMADEIRGRDSWPPDSVGDVLMRTLEAAGPDFSHQLPLGAHDIAEFRTRLASATRAAGHGRAFR